MAKCLCLTARFLQPLSHGRREGGEPEWPPSPLRAFQALTAAAAARWSDRIRLRHAVSALEWLEQQSPPRIIGPIGVPSEEKYRLYVPDNVGDKVAKSWSRGATGSIADYRTEKDVQSVSLLGDTVHYLWSLSDVDAADCEQHLPTLQAAARSITHLGWGIDMVAGDARLISHVEASQLPGERWSPSDDGMALRVPFPGTLAALVRKHEQFLNRLTADGFNPVSPLTAFRRIGYRRPTDLAAPLVAAFNLLKLDGSGYRSFDSVRQSMMVAAMLRHAASDQHIWQALGFESEQAAGFLHGHAEGRGAPHTAVTGPRLAYLPLPSIEFRGSEQRWIVGRIRRALITVVGGHADSLFQQTARMLSAAELRPLSGSEATLLSRIPADDKMVRRYTKPSAIWSTVTPVILPGYDDPRGYRRRLFLPSAEQGEVISATDQRELLAKLDRRVEYLLRKAIRQAGFSEELSKWAKLDWRCGGYRAGTAMATSYAFPNQLRRFRRLHVRIEWCDRAGNLLPMPGPICLGAGRYCGLGLFASEAR